MARYDVYRASGSGKLLLDVQADFLEFLETRIVIPLLPVASAPPATRRLHPTVRIEAADYVVATHLMAAIPASELKQVEANLGERHDDLVAALDMLFQGF